MSLKGFTYVALIFCSFIVIASYSQVKQITRYERPFKFSDDDFSVIPMKEDGIALIHYTNKYKAGNRTWEIIVLDTLLKEKETIEVEIDNRNRLIGFDHSPGWIHTLYIQNEVTGQMLLVSIQLGTKEVKQYEIKPEVNFKLTHFNKVEDNFIFGGFFNTEPCIFLFSPQNENLKLVPGFFQKNTELIDVRVNENGTFNTVVFDRSNLDHRKIILRTFDSSGKQLIEDITAAEQNITLQTGISSSLHREELLVAGTWGRKNTKTAAVGFYALTINPFSDDKLATTYFGQLDHYLDYLKPKRASSIKEKTLKAIEADKFPDYTSHVMPYKIIEHANGFLVMAESYTPTSNQNQYNYGYSPYSVSPYGNNYPYYNPYGMYSPYYYNRRFIPPSFGSNVETTEEHKKVEILAINFDASGKVLWDFSMKFIDFRTQTLKQVSEVYLEPDSLHLIYKKESELKVKTVNLETKEAVESTQDLILGFPGDKIQSEQKQLDQLECWFGNIFYAWGYQTISNKTKEDRTRNVFYVVKIRVD